MQKKDEKKIRRPLRNKMILAVTAMCLLMVTGSVVFNYRKYVSLNNAYTTELAETVINTCTLVIDGDRVANYLDSRKRDSEYYVIWNKLIDYRNTNKTIMKLSVVNFQEDGCYYIFDTDLSNKGAFLGDFCAYDAKQETVKASLINYTMNHSLVYDTHMDIYAPIKSSYNIPVAYVVVGISTASIKSELRHYLQRLVFIICAIAVVCGIILILFMNKSIISPINTMAKAASNYAEGIEKGSETSPLQQIHIKTGDELERLCESLKKMENDILVSSASLIHATWNSNHDSMTKLYNQRYYHDLLTRLEKEQSVGIIYLDIDNLKLMNDRFGHEEGDKVIRKAAGIIHQYEENGYECCRVGGDEFIMILKHTTQETVDDLVERLRNDRQNTLFDRSKDFICRLAVGGAFRKEHETIAQTIKAAEEEMYKNKHAAR